ncbi:MAG TPA: hypothetical protein VL282_07930, partial [Tepidisphaeraceae bacterium]|nr:hypothetical protein [Tepidisphaeraceae bacterium]
MAGIFGWIRNGSSKLFDPQREVRVRNAAIEVEHRLARARERFVLEDAVKDLDLFPQDVPLVAREVYRSLLQRAWRDEKVTDGDLRTLRWAAEKLKLDSKICNELRHECGTQAFQKALIRSLEDGVLTDNEVAGLRDMANQFGWEIGPLMRHCLSNESGDVLRRLFLTAIEKGRLIEPEWSRLVRTTESLGLTKSELLKAIQLQAERFVENLFANSKADGAISKSEEEILHWLLSNIISRPEFRDYIRSQIFIVQRDAAIERGDVPSIPSRRLGLRAGEIIHAEVPCEVRRTKQL